MSLPIPKDGSANVYDATTDAYVTDIQLNEELINKSPYHEIKRERKNPKAVLDPLAPDFKDVFVEKGRVMAPDEVLHALRPLTLNIPLKLREDFENPDALPDSDLLRAIHYYASASEIPKHTMDETALLALGVLVEQWAEEEIFLHEPLLYMEADDSLDYLKFVPSDPEDNDSGNESEEQANETNDSDDSASGNESARWSGEESDVMSIDLLDSDTASEVEGGRRPKRRKTMGSGVSKGIDTNGSGDSSDSSDSSGDSSSDSSSDSSDSEKIRGNSGSEDSDFGIEGFGAYKNMDHKDSEVNIGNGKMEPAKGDEKNAVIGDAKHAKSRSGSDSDLDSSSSSSSSSDSSSSDSSSSDSDT